MFKLDHRLGPFGPKLDPAVPYPRSSWIARSSGPGGETPPTRRRLPPKGPAPTHRITPNSGSRDPSKTRESKFELDRGLGPFGPRLDPAVPYPRSSWIARSSGPGGQTPPTRRRLPSKGPAPTHRITPNSGSRDPSRTRGRRLELACWGNARRRRHLAIPQERETTSASWLPIPIPRTRPSCAYGSCRSLWSL
jgi:hypothetical protein